MRMRFLLFSTVTASLALNGCRSRAAEFTAQDEATIRAMFDTRVADIRAGNWVKWSNQHAEGIVLQPPNGPTVKGRTALLAWGQAFPPIDSLELSDIQIWGDGNLAYATSGVHAEAKGPSSRRRQGTSRLSAVARRPMAGRGAQPQFGPTTARGFSGESAFEVDRRG